MSKNKAQNIIIHNTKNTDRHALLSRVNEFHVELIERRLRKSNLTIQQKIAIIDTIIETLKSREINGTIK